MFEFEELLARINALFRRITFTKPEIEANPTFKELTLIPSKMCCKFGETEIQLSKTEYMMIKCFMENQNKVLSRSEIIDVIWGKGHFIDENTIDVYVGYIRSKIEAFTTEEYIKTVRGSGYMMA